MTVDSGKVIDWYRSNEGKITYSMGPGSGVDQGPRQIIGYGKGGSTDCSGGITSALYYGGAEPKQEEGAYPNYSTMNIGSLLSSNGYEKIPDQILVVQECGILKRETLSTWVLVL